MAYTVEDASRDYESRGGKYPVSYHIALQHLIYHGPHKETARGRSLCAKALTDLRKQFGRRFALLTRSHMLYVCGMFPAKGA